MHRVAQRLELRVGLVDAHRQGADGLDLADVLADEEALLQLVGEQEVARVGELGCGEVALEEARPGAGLVLQSRTARRRRAVAPSLWFGLVSTKYFSRM